MTTTNTSLTTSPVTLFSSYLAFFFFLSYKEHLNVTGHNVSFSEIQVYWNPIHLDIPGYSVRYWAEKEGKRSAVVRNVSKTTQGLLIDRLKPFTVYVINVTALKNGEKFSGQRGTKELF